MSDEQYDDLEWTPEALANYDAAHARLVSVLDQFGAAVHAAMPLRSEGPELTALRDQVDRALADLDRASGDLTGEYFDTIAPTDFDDDEDDEDDDAPGEPTDPAGVGVSVIWRLDVRVDRPEALGARAQALYREHFPSMDDAEIRSNIHSSGTALQAVTELAGMEALIDTDGVRPLGGVRVYVVTDDLLAGSDAQDSLLDLEEEDDDERVRWTREKASFLLPAEGRVGFTEGFDFA